MVKKKKNNWSILIFIALLLTLLFLSPYTSFQSTPLENDNLIQLSDREFVGWIDVLPKEDEGLRFFVNQFALTKVAISHIPMFPYENPLFLIMVDSAYTKDTFLKEDLRSYLRNKKFEIFEFDNNWIEALNKANKKAEMVSDPCILLLIGAPPANNDVFFDGVFLRPLFLWTNQEKIKEGDFSVKLVHSTGGEVYYLDDPNSIEKMDITIHTPIQLKRIQFKGSIPFLGQFYPSKLVIQNQFINTTIRLHPSQHRINQIRWIYRFLFFLLVVDSLFVFLSLFQKSRKKWKKRKKKLDDKKAKKQYCIAWIEEESKNIASKRLTKSPFVIGCSLDCDLVLYNDASISAKHCQIVETKCAFFLFDMISRNGTYVNSQRINQTKLKTGDRIQIGGTILIFRQSALQYTSHEKVL